MTRVFEAGTRNWSDRYGFVLAVTDFGEGAGTIGDVASAMEDMVTSGGWSVADSLPQVYDAGGVFIAAQAAPEPGGEEIRVAAYVEMDGRMFEGDERPDLVAAAQRAADSTARATQKRLRYRYPGAKVRSIGVFLAEERPAWAR